MKVLNVMNAVLTIFGFIGVVFWASDRYEETLSEITQLSENLEEAQNKLSQFEELRDELVAQEARLTTLRSDIPIISKEAAGEAVAATNEELQQLKNKFDKFSANISSVDVVPDGIIEVEENVVYDLVSGMTFLVDIRRGGSRFLLNLIVAGEHVSVLKIGQHANLGPNNECMIEFISARDIENENSRAVIRKSCS